MFALKTERVLTFCNVVLLYFTELLLLEAREGRHFGNDSEIFEEYEKTTTNKYVHVD